MFGSHLYLFLEEISILVAFQLFNYLFIIIIFSGIELYVLPVYFID